MLCMQSNLSSIPRRAHGFSSMIRSEPWVPKYSWVWFKKKKLKKVKSSISKAVFGKPESFNMEECFEMLNLLGLANPRTKFVLQHIPSTFCGPGSLERNQRMSVNLPESGTGTRLGFHNLRARWGRAWPDEICCRMRNGKSKTSFSPCPCSEGIVLALQTKVQG